MKNQYFRNIFLIIFSITIFIVNLFLLDIWQEPFVSIIIALIGIYAFYSATARFRISRYTKKTEREIIKSISLEEKNTNKKQKFTEGWKLTYDLFTEQKENARFKAEAKTNMVMRFLLTAITCLALFFQAPDWVIYVLGISILIQGFSVIILYNHYEKEIAIDEDENKRFENFSKAGDQNV